VHCTVFKLRKKVSNYSRVLRCGVTCFSQDGCSYGVPLPLPDRRPLPLCPSLKSVAFLSSDGLLVAGHGFPGDETFIHAAKPPTEKAAEQREKLVGGIWIH